MELKDFTEKEQEMIKKRLTMSNISDKETTEKILALVPQDLIKRIPFFVRKHATTRTIKRISIEYPELYAVAQTSGEIPEKEREELRQIITTIFEQKMNKHSIKQRIKKYFISGLGSNAYHSEEESICLIGHSLGGDLARYFASEFEEVKKLILLDGGYLDLDKILPLDTELEETKNYIKSQIISDLDILTSKEKSEAKHWSENMEKAVRQSYHWNVEYNRYELAINYENIEAILRLRRKIQAFKREVGDTLFISPRYPNEATWREEALKELPDYFDTIFLENFGHELYTQAPKEIASLMNEWLAYFL